MTIFVVFNQTGMDFVTEISFYIKTPVVHEKGWFLEVGSQLEKSFKDVPAKIF